MRRPATPAEVAEEAVRLACRPDPYSYGHYAGLRRAMSRALGNCNTNARVSELIRSAGGDTKVLVAASHELRSRPVAVERDLAGALLDLAIVRNPEGTAWGPWSEDRCRR